MGNALGSSLGRQDGSTGGKGIATLWYFIRVFRLETACQMKTFSSLLTIATGFLALAVSLPDQGRAEEAGPTPSVRQIKPLFEGATAVTTGFSGPKRYRPVLAKDERPLPDPAYSFIDPDGVVASLTRVSDMKRVPDGSVLERAPYDRILARDTGQVFGIAINDRPRPDLYLTATSAFGLQIVGPDADGDHLPDRLRRGGPGARWMAGQWGPYPDAGPGSVWKVDGLSGQVSLLANISHDGRTNSGAGLGNIAYDRVHEQLFVSDLESGLIHRLDMQGRDLGQWDHGLSARTAEDLTPTLRKVGPGIDINSPDFDIEDPQTWGFAPPERRVWGLVVHDGRLYYSVAEGREKRPEVWSVGLARKTGAFLEDPRWELTLPAHVPGAEISDLAFTATGAMLVAQRGQRMGSFDYRRFARDGQAGVLRFLREDPEDPAASLTPSDWIWARDDYDIGFAHGGLGATGGLALGPGYDGRGRADFRACKDTLWTTGEDLRNRSDLRNYLEPGGPLDIDGLQAQPVALGRAHNSPPWVSYFLDHVQAGAPIDQVSGHMGDVEVLGCHGGGGGAPAAIAPKLAELAELPKSPDLCPGGSCILILCLINPSLCLPDENDGAQCTVSSSDLRCDETTGTWVLDVTMSATTGNLDWLKLDDPAGSITALPLQTPMPANTSIPLTGLAPGQAGQIDLCAYDSAQAASGNPYDCCNATVNFRLPEAACEVKEH